MKNRFLQLVLLGFTSLQFCSCSPKDDGESNVATETNLTAVVTNDSSPPNHPPVTAILANPYEGIPDNQPIIHRARAGEPDAEGWCLAKSTRGRFSVMLPGQFVDTMIKMPTTTGGIGVMHSVSTRNADGLEVTVLHSEVIGKLPEEGPLKGMIQRFKDLGASVNQTEMLFVNLPAVRMRVSAQGVEAEFIHVDATNGSYMLAVQARPPQPDNTSLATDTERFFLSFKIE
ncbi:MAG: hypothetical protein ACPGVU_21440 [Limisphaerales bacterium]